MKRARKPYAVVALVGLLAQAGLSGFVIVRQGGVGAYAFRSLDAKEYFALGHNLESTHTFSAQAEPPRTPETWRTPGYPLLLAAGMALVGPHPVGLIILQQLLSVANVLLFFGIARTVMSERRAMIAAGLFLFAPYRLYYSLWLLATTCFTTALLGTWYCWRRARNSGGTLAALGTGLMLGATVLIRPIALLLPVVLVVAAAFPRRQSEAAPTPHPRPRWTSALAMLTGCLVLLGGWSARNRAVAGHWGLSSQSGVVLAYFKAAEVELWRQGRAADRYVETSLDPSNLGKPHTVWDDIDRGLHERLADLPQNTLSTLTWRRLAQGNRGDYDPFVVSSTLAAIARRMLWQAPLATAAVCLERCAMILTFPAHLVFDREATTSRRVLHGAIGILYTALLLAALIRLFRRRICWSDVLFPMAALLCLLIATTPQLDPRFRVPMLPFLLLIAFLPVPRRGTKAENREPSHADIGPDASHNEA